MRTTRATPLCLSDRGTHGLLQLHRGLLQSDPAALRPGVSLAHLLRTGDANRPTIRHPLNRPLKRGNFTLDAMGCQRAIAECILARGGDYLLTLEANHPSAQAAVAAHFEEHCFRPGASVPAACDAFEDSHGRLVRRRVFARTDAVHLEALGGWPGLRTVLAVESIRSVHGTDKVESEIRYFLSSCRDDPAVLAAAIRAHWSIENAVHWVLDVTFREDDSRVRHRTAARNLALVRKIALNLIGRDRSSTASVRARRKRAAWNDDYMFQLLAGRSQSLTKP